MSKPKAVPMTLSSDAILQINGVTSKVWSGVFAVIDSCDFTSEEASKVADAAKTATGKALGKLLGTPIPQTASAAASVPAPA